MSFYDYYCPANKRTVEVRHEIGKKLKTWGELCQLADMDPGKTSLDSPVKRMISTPQVSAPAGDAKLKELGFTKLVRRDKGVYENVTAKKKEKRIIKADDTSS